MQLSNDIDRLAEFALFRAVSHEALLALGQGAEVRRFGAETPVDTPSGTVLIILEGEAACYLHDAAGQPFLLSTQGPGSPLGELSHLVEGQGYDEKISVVARTPVSGVQVISTKFFACILSAPASATEYLRILASRLADMNRFGKQAVDVNMDPSAVSARTVHEQLADAVTTRIGSFRFLGLLGLFSGGWVLLNVGLIATIGWDPYPFVFLNLMYSVMSGITAPIILISQSRQAQLDRQAARAQHLVTLDTARMIDDLRLHVLAIGQRVELLSGRLPPAAALPPEG